MIEWNSMSDSLKFSLLVVMAFAIATLMTLVVRRAIRYVIRKRWEDGDEDVTRLKFLGNSISAVFYSMAVIFIFREIPALSHLGTALFAGAGVLAAVIGFASQKAFSNIVSGIFILLFRPFKVGDAVNVGGRSGVIEDITLRHTVIKDYENRRVIIPNSIISDETIVNSNINDKAIRQQVFFGVGYDADLNQAIAIIAEEAMDHRLSVDNRTAEEKASNHPAVMIRVLSWGDSSIELRAQIWTIGIDEGFVLKCDLLKSVKERFDKEGISIPYPHRTVILKREGETILGENE
jgi:small conductance mechanosensitive channel